MGHVFRIYDGGANTYSGWNGAQQYPYNATSRKTIADPDGATAKKQITSIPSPFARIDLIKNAFREVCDSNNLDGSTIFHRMVSDSLDVGEIFFNIEKFQDKVEIITCNIQSCIQNLRNSGSQGHQILADALSKYLVADAQTYNFKTLQNIYLLNYKLGNAPINIIGATSPATIFFSNANDLKYVSDNLSFGTDKPFDFALQPLYKRDFEYVKSWFALRKSIPDFAILFPEVNDYLDLTYRAIESQEQKNMLLAVQPNDSSFHTIPVSSGQQNNIVEVLGYNLLAKYVDINNIQSDFQIKPTTDFNGRLLVLPIESGNTYADLNYITDKWGHENVAPFRVNQALNKRQLPNEGTLMPYITIGDIMEDYLVSVPHELNKDCFYDGNIGIENKAQSYLLPIKTDFFKYFTVDDLISKTFTDGKRMFEMKTYAGGEGVSATLRVPIVGNGKVEYIAYERTFYKDQSVDTESNNGCIKQVDFQSLIMPFVKFDVDSDALYKVASVYNPEGIDMNVFSFFNGDKAVSNVDVLSRYDEKLAVSPRKADVYTIEKAAFEYIQVSNNQWKGIIVPKWKSQKAFNQIEYAVDLGTSNTHIEMRMGGKGNSQGLNYSSADAPFAKTFIPTYVKEINGYVGLQSENWILDHDFLPEFVGGESDYCFPTRTVLSCAKGADNNAFVPYGNVNIPLTHDRRDNLSYNKLLFDIKWGSGEAAKNMNAYIDCLMLTLRNMTLACDGDLSKTKLVWSYPSSMPNKRLSRLRDAWNDSFKKYFNAGLTSSMTESLAPLQYYFNRYNTATKFVNIDIGGGTTDVAYAVNREVKFTTSFRFAANSLFEDVYAPLNNSNGIVDYYKRIVRDVLNEKGISDFDGLFDAYNDSPANMASFLFSLKNNSLLLKNKDLDINSVDFNRCLSDDEDFKIVFILFYTAIIYHVAQIVKSKGLDIPRHISLGGNGSKVIRVITTDSQVLAKYTKLIFEKVLGKKSDGKLEIYRA